MSQTTQVEQLAAFTLRASFDELSGRALERLKLHVLDSLGCAIGALNSEPTRAVRRQAEAFGGSQSGPCTLIAGGACPPDRAGLVNGALVRYLDYMDNFLAPQQTCHPCDTLSSVLAASEVCQLSGREFVTCLAVAYQVFCRLVWEAPVQELGFDHTVQLAYGVAAGTSKALGLTLEQTAHALAIAGASAQGLVVTRAEYLSNWKGLQSADVAMSALTGVLLAREGITGPLQILDGKEGFQKAFKHQVQIDWQREPLDIILRCSLKAHNAEVHTQPVLEAVLRLREEHGLDKRLDEIERVELEVFKQAYDITGSGEEAGNKYDVRTKEQADHSLPYLTAVALLDGEITPHQFTSERIQAQDVQGLLHKVRTLRDDQFTRRYPDETPCRVVVEFRDGRSVAAEAKDWLGFYARPMPAEQVRQKFRALTADHLDDRLASELRDMVFDLENVPVKDLTSRLAQAAAKPLERVA
jgi:2-methylcitrate dehydratase